MWMALAIAGSCTADSDRPGPADTSATLIPTQDLTVVDGGEVRCAEPSLRDFLERAIAGMKGESRSAVKRAANSATLTLRVACTPRRSRSRQAGA